MDTVTKVSGRGTSSRNVKSGKSTWAGEQYKEYQQKRKEIANDAYVTVGRGTKNIKLGNITNSKSTSTKGRYVSVGRGTGRRKLN